MAKDARVRRIRELKRKMHPLTRRQRWAVRTKNLPVALEMTDKKAPILKEIIALENELMKEKKKRN